LLNIDILYTLHLIKRSEESVLFAYKRGFDVGGGALAQVDLRGRVGGMSVVKGENALLRAVIRDHVGHPVPVHVRELHHQITAHLISLDEAVGLLGCCHALNVDLIE